jgi:hypothetical protein
MKPLIIIAANAYHEMQAFGVYKNKVIAQEAVEKYEAKFPSLDFFFMPIEKGYLVSSKRNK